MNNIYVTKISGAPSLSCIIFSDCEIKKIDWKFIAQNTYKKICENKIKLSKMAILYKKNDNLYDFKFIQIKKKDEKIDFETNANCGNSMLAAAKVIFEISKNKEGIVIKNIDTNFEMMIKNFDDCYKINVLSLENQNINNFKMFDKANECKVCYKGKIIKYYLINAVNEYILINSEDIGIKSKEELLSLDKNDDKYLQMVKEIRNLVIEKNNMKKDSEFPKIAVVYNKEKLAARTIYLNGWHSGLPLTGAITIMIATKIKDSNLYRNKFNDDIICTPKGEKTIKVDIDENGNILNVMGVLQKMPIMEDNVTLLF